MADYTTPVFPAGTIEKNYVIPETIDEILDGFEFERRVKTGARINNAVALAEFERKAYAVAAIIASLASTALFIYLMSLMFG